MDHRQLGKVARDQGGYALFYGGVIWEGFEVAHKLKYIRELGDTIDWKAIATHLWHPSPLAIVAVGCAWSIAAHILRRRRDTRAHPPIRAEAEVVKEVPATEQTLEASNTNVVELTKALKPGETCEIEEEVQIIRKRKITLHSELPAPPQTGNSSGSAESEDRRRSAV